MALSQSAIDMVKATAPAVAPHAKTIVTNFYKKMLGSHPELYAFFNKGHQSSGRQPQALTDAVLAYATNIDNLGVLGPAVGLMATKHCALQVMPEHYGIVHDNLMASIAEILGPDVATPEVGAGWSEAVMALAGILIEEEAKMYAAAAARKGGWKGWREFKLAAKEEVAPGVCTFTWEAADGYKEGFEFTPGQYMTLSLGLKDEGGDIISPRHYTITSPPGAATLQCTVKHLEGGVVSTALHGMEVGASVNMSPPFGVFTPPAEGDVVLVGAGVGVTPMYAFQQAMGERVAAVLQVDKSAAAAPFSSYFAGAANSFSLVESTDGRPAAAELVSTLAGTVDLTDKEVLLCGPGSFMADMKAALAEAGAKKVSYENFGPRS